MFIFINVKLFPVIIVRFWWIFTIYHDSLLIISVTILYYPCSISDITVQLLHEIFYFPLTKHRMYGYLTLISLARLHVPFYCYIQQGTAIFDSCNKNYRNLVIDQSMIAGEFHTLLFLHIWWVYLDHSKPHNLYLILFKHHNMVVVNNIISPVVRSKLYPIVNCPWMAVRTLLNRSTVN